jgi:hypothetical protein
MTEQEAWWRAAERIQFGTDACLCAAVMNMLDDNEITPNLHGSMRERLRLFRPYESSSCAVYWWADPYGFSLSVSRPENKKVRQERILACLFLAAMAAR